MSSRLLGALVAALVCAAGCGIVPDEPETAAQCPELTISLPALLLRDSVDDLQTSEGWGYGPIIEDEDRHELARRPAGACDHKSLVPDIEIIDVPHVTSHVFHEATNAGSEFRERAYFIENADVWDEGDLPWHEFSEDGWTYRHECHSGSPTEACNWVSFAWNDQLLITLFMYRGGLSEINAYMQMLAEATSLASVDS